MNLFKKVAAIEQSACNFYIYHNLSMNDERLALYDPIVSKLLYSFLNIHWIVK
uniref:SJCHGC08485 protein n=1 Tax=Schistosoma japonicum TaxID=6182 RepID=Q5BRE8_SCHJA|nr:SJCHGC08485 protein [Schistosoma japonicum]